MTPSETNFDALGTASLDWRNQGAMVVVLTDLLHDVDDDALNDGSSASGGGNRGVRVGVWVIEGGLSAGRHGGAPRAANCSD